MRFGKVAIVAIALAAAGCSGGSDGDAASGEPGSKDGGVNRAADAGTGSTDGAAADASGYGDGEAADAGTAADASSHGDATAPSWPVDVTCRPGLQGEPARYYVDRTAAVGLEGVHGVRLGAVDLDGDGYADLVVRSGKGTDDFAAGKRATWVLLNRPAPDGTGRVFVDFTEESGLLRRPDGSQGHTTRVVVFADVDNDGDLDAFVGVPVDPKADNGDRSAIYLNDGTGHFSWTDPGDVAHPDEALPLYGAAFVDYDRDGFVDLWVAYAWGDQPEADRLYRGDGTGRFTDVTEAEGLMTPPPPYSVADMNAMANHRNSWGATACDVDGDGWPDLLASTYGRGFNSLWRGGPEGFADIAFDSGAAADEDADWTTNYNAQCYCKLNPTAPDCAGVPPPPDFFPCAPGQTLRWNHDYDREPFRNGGNTFTTLCADMDNDGAMDLVNFEIVHWDVGPSSDPTRVLFNDGAAPPHFERPTLDDLGLVRTWGGRIDWNAGDMTGAAFDLDNDGWKDLLIGSSDYPGTRAFLYRQDAPRHFVEIPPDRGILHPRSHGVAIADFDRDGDLDVVLGHSRARCGGADDCYDTPQVHYFRNDAGAANNWLQLRLAAPAGANRASVGARVTVEAGGLVQVQEVSGGYGHFGIQHDLVVHFGLGAACAADRVEVRWPDAQGSTTVVHALPANHRWVVDPTADPAVQLDDP